MWPAIYLKEIKMRNKLALMLIAAAALGLSACDDQKTTSTETTEVSTIDGTTTESVTTTETTVDEDGNMSVETDSETTVDPEGLMNQETIEETHTEETYEVTE